jgi:hypothetical protein
MTTNYVETSIPSFYYESRTEATMVARREWTRRWWDYAVVSENIVSSVAVLDELQSGNFPGRDNALTLIDTIGFLEINEAISEIVEAYIAHHLMPADPFGDALHLAIASYHCCDFLVTWNCRHLANANKFGHIRRVNGILGLFVPSLVTPLELLGEDLSQ